MKPGLTVVLLLFATLCASSVAFGQCSQTIDMTTFKFCVTENGTLGMIQIEGIDLLDPLNPVENTFYIALDKEGGKSSGYGLWELGTLTQPNGPGTLPLVWKAQKNCDSGKCIPAHITQKITANRAMKTITIIQEFPISCSFDCTWWGPMTRFASVGKDGAGAIFSTSGGISVALIPHTHHGLAISSDQSCADVVATSASSTECGTGQMSPFVGNGTLNGIDYWGSMNGSIGYAKFVYQIF